VKNGSGTGAGTVRCDDNESMIVKIRVKGSGIAPGKRKIESGRGEFSAVPRIDDLVGTYVAEPSGDAAKTPHAQVFILGSTRLILSGGEGWDQGITFESFEISPRRSKPA